MPFKTTKSDMIKSDTKLNMTVTTEDRGRQNVWAKEPRMEVMDVAVTHNEKAEKLNGRLAMLGVVAALGSYAVTGQMIPGLW
jgi:hypothetical protein